MEPLCPFGSRFAQLNSCLATACVVKNVPFRLMLTFNNGLSATADFVTWMKTPAGPAVASIGNLQIVNGARTTGSIHAGLKTAKEQLSQIYVQMKLTVVPPERSEEIVPKISGFAIVGAQEHSCDGWFSHSHTEPSSGWSKERWKTKPTRSRIVVEAFFSGAVKALIKSLEFSTRPILTNSRAISVPSPRPSWLGNVKYAISTLPATGGDLNPQVPIISSPSATK